MKKTMRPVSKCKRSTQPPNGSVVQGRLRVCCSCKRLGAGGRMTVGKSMGDLAHYTACGMASGHLNPRVTSPTKASHLITTLSPTLLSPYTKLPHKTSLHYCSAPGYTTDAFGSGLACFYSNDVLEVCGTSFAFFIHISLGLLSYVPYGVYALVRLGVLTMHSLQSFLHILNLHIYLSLFLYRLYHG